MAENEIKLSVIAPLYNEETVIADSIDKLVETLEEFPESWELILVNDGSTDGSLSIITEKTRQDKRIKVLSYKNNRGRGFALRTGFNQSRGKYVVTTESDLTWGKDIISRLYRELLDSDAEVVIASPYAEGGKLENVPWKRAFLSRMGNKILRLTVPSSITMLSGMTRGYQGEVIRSLPLEETGKEIHLEIVSKAVMLGCRISEVPATLRWEPPPKGKPARKSKFKAGKLIKSHLLFGFNEAPILLFGSLGSVACLTGMILGIYLCYLYFLKGQVIGDRVVLIMTTIFLILAGFSMFLFCFLSYQIKDLRKDILKLRHQQHPRSSTSTSCETTEN
jgi:dolichol-phosphate mannosyltransferase